MVYVEWAIGKAITVESICKIFPTRIIFIVISSHTGIQMGKCDLIFSTLRGYIWFSFEHFQNLCAFNKAKLWQ